MNDKKQITKIVKLEIVESVSFKDLKSAYINDMRISKSQPLSEMKTIIDIDCREDYILEALGYSKDSVVLSKEEFWKLSNKFSKKELDDISQFRVNKARKETAIEFSEKIKNKIKELKQRYHEDYVNGLGDEKYNGLTENNVDELLKEMGVK